VAESTTITNAQELVKRSLFLFGAGATRDAGCKVSKDMLEALQKMDWTAPEKEAIDFLLSCLSYHATWKNQKEGKSYNSTPYAPNIEDLVLLIRRIVNRDSYLPYPITGSWADKITFLELEWRELPQHRQSAQTVKPLFINLEEKITRKLYEWLKLGKENTDYLNPISEYLKVTSDSGPRLEFFTTNYDLVFEKHFNREDVTNLDCGFNAGIYSGIDHQKPSCRINYYKLHGSLNWKRNNLGKTAEFFSYNNDGTKLKVLEEPEGSESIESEVQEIEPDKFLSSPPADPLIIFGHGGKFLSIDPFISLIYDFKQLLTEKDIYFVIGYSFFDPYINNIILEGLSKGGVNPKRMIVVNPGFSKEAMFSTEENNDGVTEENWKSRFVDYIQNIQRSTYLSDLPGYNITEVSPSLIKIIPEKTSSFLSQYFGTNCEGLSALFGELEGEREDIFK